MTRSWACRRASAAGRLGKLAVKPFHEPKGGFVRDAPEAGEHAAGPGVEKGAVQALHLVPALQGADPRFARAQDHEPGVHAEAEDLNHLHVPRRSSRPAPGEEPT